MIVRVVEKTHGDVKWEGTEESEARRNERERERERESSLSVKVDS
jgi:hypothetical protein